MAAQNPTSSEPNSIWIIVCVLFICVVAGGGCLSFYMLRPESETAPWLPVVGVVLVCLPWLFWILTFLYRVLSRASGYRLGAPNFTNNNNASSGNMGVGSQANNDAPNALNRASSVASHDSEKPLKS